MATFDKAHCSKARACFLVQGIKSQSLISASRLFLAPAYLRKRYPISALPARFGIGSKVGIKTQVFAFFFAYIAFRMAELATNSWYLSLVTSSRLRPSHPGY
jgi:hypothetical protein